MTRKSKPDVVAPRGSKGHAVPVSASPGDGASVRAQLEKTLLDREKQRYVLKLYVTGVTLASSRAVERVRAVCEKHLQGRYELEVIDIYQLPALAKDEQIIATPTLIKVLPAPLRRYIGNLMNVEKVLFGVDLREKR
jgi:circadian clock protein KaiB